MKTLCKACVIVGVLVMARAAVAQECPQPTQEPEQQPPEQQPPEQQPPEQQPPATAQPPPQQPATAPQQTYEQPTYQEPTYQQQPTYAHPRRAVPYGMSLSVGGGIMNFTDGDTRNFTDLGGTWEARLAWGIDLPLTIEGAYTGSAQSVDALGLDSSAVLLGTNVEGDLRWNIIPGILEPYILAGAGWSHFSITNDDFNTSDVKDSTNGFAVPLGAGVMYQMGSFMLDARGVYRPVFNSDLVRDTATDSSSARLDNWTAMLRGGFVF